jgi:transposase InsO family protein
MCEFLAVSRSGYYAWKKRGQSKRAQADTALVSQIRYIYTESRKVYGYPRIHVALRIQGVRVARKRVARLMRVNGIVAAPHRRMRWKSAFKTATAADNLVQRQFNVPQPNQVWAADMTAFWTGSGWVHLAIVMDLFSRRIVGWSMHGQMTERLVLDALEMAILSRQPADSLIHHSDQGSQYRSHLFQTKLREYNIQISMSRRGNCWDNAVVESFFKTLKTELQNDARFGSREEARSQLFEYIEVFYNRRRMHSTLGYLSPAQYELNCPSLVSVKAG